MKCKEKVTDSERQRLFQEYWSMGDHDKRVSYVASLIRTREKASCRLRGGEDEKSKYRFLTHSYNLDVSGEKVVVCKGCFLKVFGETNSFIEQVLAKKQG